MLPFSGPVQQWITSKRAVLCCLLLSTLACLCLGASLFYSSPLYVDSGWFSYPASAMAQRGDPGDNQLSIEEISRLPGISAIFSFDTRKSIRIIPLAFWFHLAGTSVWAVKAYGIIELFIVYGLILYLFVKITPSLRLALVCWSLLIMDRALIESGFTDMRPDIFISIIALLIYYCIRRTGEFRPGKWILALLLMVPLAMSHSTAAVPIAFLLSYATLELLGRWHTLDNKQRVMMIAFLVVGGGSYLLRQPLADLIIPTQYRVHGAIDVKGEVMDRLSKGPIHILQTELLRWKNYFFVSNIATLMVMAIIPLVYLTGRRLTPTCRFTFPLSLLAGVLILSIDPHPWPAHAIPLIPLFFVYLLSLAHFLPAKRQKVLLLVLILLLLPTVLLKFAATIKVHRTNRATGYNHVAAIRLIQETFRQPTTGIHYLVIGPTELWPYLPPSSNITLVDTTRCKNIHTLKPYLQKIDYVLLNHDYTHSNWIKRFEQTFPSYKTVPVLEVGDKYKGWAYVGIYRIMPR